MFRARLRARLCRGKEGLHQAPTFVRQFDGYTHILLLFLSSTHYYCPFAAGTMPNSLYRMPLAYLSLTCVICYSCSFLFVVCVCVFLCSHWSLVDVPLIFFCPADHVPDWQPRVLLGMVEARSVNVKKTTTTTTTLRPSKGGLKRQSLLQTWCGSAPRRGPSANGYDAWRFGQLLLQTWRGSAPRRGPSANGYDAWRFGSCGPGCKILAAAAADLVWVCAPPRTIRKWLRRLAFWILRTRAQDPCSCCCRPGVGLRTAADHPQMVTTPGVLDPADPRARSLQLLLDISDKSG